MIAPFLAFILPARADDLPCPATAADLSATLDQALVAYGAWDWSTWARTASRLDTLLPCLHEALSPDDAARIHKVEGLEAWVRRDPAAVETAFRAWFAIQPKADLGDAWAPAGSPLEAAEARARGAGAVASVALPEGTWLVDGYPGIRALAPDRNAVVQRLDAAGITTGYAVGGALPKDLLPTVAPVTAAPVTAAPVTAAPVTVVPVTAAPLRHDRALLWAGGVTTVAGVACLGAAWVTRERAMSGEVTEEAFQRLETWNRVTGWAGPVLGAAGLGVGIAGVWGR